MSDVLVRAQGALTLIGGGPVEPRDMDEALALAPRIVAADGGLNHLSIGQVRPEAVIGDIDSTDPALAERHGVPVHKIAEQDSTDLEKCLRSIEASAIIGIGFLGGQTDHHLAAMNTLVRTKRCPVVLLGGDDICFRCPAELCLDLEAGTRVSLFPMAPSVGHISEGLRWSVNRLAMRPDGQIGTSNEASGGRMRVGFEDAPVLVILPRQTLGQVFAVLSPLGG
ncbi:MAG: thiamine diphosphokinase [Pseudomonadota bacterium]